MVINTSSESGYRFDCSFCDTVLQSKAVEELKDDGRRHLKGHDYQELSGTFAEAYGGDECENDCGYVRPASSDAIDGFECPNCGHDHRHAFVRQHLYWQIEAA